MVFSSVLFLFLFLPIVLSVYFLLPEKLKNAFLLISSLFFYAWGEYDRVFLMIFSIGFNYLMGINIGDKTYSKKSRRFLLGLSIICNLSILGYYKYSGFLLQNLSYIGMLSFTRLVKIDLPIGISFFTFQAISYLIDVYRHQVTAQKNILNLGLYISLFPQLIAGPIVRYADVSHEINNRSVTRKNFVSGVNRFIIGLAKKVLIANNIGIIADEVFNSTISQLPSSIAWLGIICFSLQIYFDFSGYSDMAIGLGRMFGFNFKENFNFPYYAKSIRDFWRRWHISLSVWFRDYLYIPLGGNRRGEKRTYLNLVTVFLLTGLWHGASWNFIIWGLFHGIFMLLEKKVSFRVPKSFSFLGTFYVLLVVISGWVFFRADSLQEAIIFFIRLFSFSSGSYYAPLLHINAYKIIIFFLAIFFCFPVFKNEFLNKIHKLEWVNMVFNLKYVLYLLLLLFSILELSNETYNPFIYYRF